MDRAKISMIAHADHPIAAPLDDGTVDELLDHALRGCRSVLDLGCGSGTWLLRALRRSSSLHAVGVDLVGDGFDQVRDDAERAGVAGGLELHRADASGWTSSDRFDLVLCIGATHAFGGLDQTLAACRRHLLPGGSVLVGECFWEQPPSAAALDVLGASVDDYDDLPTTVATATSAGWFPLHGHVSTAPEWDAYEWSWTGLLTRWALAHPDDPDHDEALRVAAEHRRAWLRGYRGTLGFVTLLLAPDPGPTPAPAPAAQPDQRFTQVVAARPR